jgi:hypothetical protein
MVVDNEGSLAALAASMPAQLGHEPVGFKSSLGVSATFGAAPERFDVVLRNETLPDLAGEELAQ